MKFIKTIWATQLSELVTWSSSLIQSMGKKSEHQSIKTESASASKETSIQQYPSAQSYMETVSAIGQEKSKKS